MNIDDLRDWEEKSARIVKSVWKKEEKEALLLSEKFPIYTGLSLESPEIKKVIGNYDRLPLYTYSTPHTIDFFEENNLIKEKSSIQLTDINTELCVYVRDKSLRENINKPLIGYIVKFNTEKVNETKGNITSLFAKQKTVLKKVEPIAFFEDLILGKDYSIYENDKFISQFRNTPSDQQQLLEGMMVIQSAQEEARWVTEVELRKYIQSNNLPKVKENLNQEFLAKSSYTLSKARGGDCYLLMKKK